MKETPRALNDSRKRKQPSFLRRSLINSLLFLSRSLVGGTKRRRRKWWWCKTNFSFYIHCARLVFIDSASGIQLESRLTSITIPGALGEPARCTFVDALVSTAAASKMQVKIENGENASRRPRGPAARLDNVEYMPINRENSRRN